MQSAPATATLAHDVPRPTAGRQVRFVLHRGPNAGEERASIVAGVHDRETGLVELQVFLCVGDGPELLGFAPSENGGEPGTLYQAHFVRVPYDPEGAPGTWHWPEIADRDRGLSGGLSRV